MNDLQEMWAKDDCLYMVWIQILEVLPLQKYGGYGMSTVTVGVITVLIGAIGGFFVGWAACEYWMIKRIERALYGRKRIQRR